MSDKKLKTVIEVVDKYSKELTAYYDKVSQTPVKITFENYHDA